jgi:hypothetical protein
MSLEVFLLFLIYQIIWGALVSVLLKVWYNSALNPSSPVFCWEILYYCLNHIAHYLFVLFLFFFFCIFLNKYWWLIESINLPISFRFSNLLEYKFSNIPCILVVSVVKSNYSSLIFINLFSLCLISSLTKGFTILFILSKNQHYFIEPFIIILILISFFSDPILFLSFH